MRTNIIRIGNSRGIRIPKAVLDQCGFESAVELEVGDRQLVIRPAERPRQGWDEAFRRMAEHGDDELLDGGLASRSAWDAAEWEW